MTGNPPGRPEPEERSSFDWSQWEIVGIPEPEALAWWERRFRPNDAQRWRQAGISQPIEAIRWKTAGIGPANVGEWLYVKIDAHEAAAWMELGFTVAEARRHKRAGRTPVQAYGQQHRANPGSAAGVHIPGTPRHRVEPRHFMEAVRRRNPQVAQTYMQRQWFDDEAIAWAMHGIEAGEALAWKELGLTPVEAERQQSQGMNAIQTVKAWWKAGIPFDEVAEWIGAGLSPSEAARQRANGVSAERAAVLRSLQQDD
ncbi:MAG: hypothetical protein JO372_20310 [Solirubrobacterales bacterium]|nr:hypothetical protein [Solirubrobacterales bacterium]